MQKIWFFWSELKGTFWFVPVLIILSAIILAILLLNVDTHIEFTQEGLGRYLFVGSAGSARSVLTTVSGAMIGVAGTVFSITLVAITLASSQLGPRLINNFMYDRLNQIVLGSYISTYLYCLIVLNTIKENGAVVFIPSLSILIALLAALINILLLIVFIHHIAVSIQADRVISDISRLLSKNIEVLFPEKMGEEKEETTTENEVAARSLFRERHTIRSKQNGYIRHIDNDSLLELLVEIDGLADLHFRPGDFLVEGAEIYTIYSVNPMEEGTVDRFRSKLIIGETRSQQQDPEYAIHQMVEIAARALSPGVNDPFTAISCIDNLTASMVYLTKVKFPSKYRYDDAGNLRVIAETVTYEGMLAAAFNQIRQFSMGSPSVVIRLMESLSTIHKYATRPSQKEAISKHAEMVFNMASGSFKDSHDLKDLKEKGQLLLATGE